MGEFYSRIVQVCLRKNFLNNFRDRMIKINNKEAEQDCTILASCLCIFARNKGNMVELIGVISPYNDITRSNKMTAR